MNDTTNTKKPSVKSAHAACAVCMKEIPVSEANVAEAKDYVAHFCSPDCYQKWRQQNGSMPRQ